VKEGKEGREGRKCSADDEGGKVEKGRKEGQEEGMKDRKEGKKIKKGLVARTMNEGRR
jgi:hypothetical protein